MPAHPNVARLDTTEITKAIDNSIIRSAIWQQGKRLDNSESYDSCVAFVRVPLGSKDDDGKDPVIMAVLCVWVYSCQCRTEDGKSRGNTHLICGKIEWWYFFPIYVDSVGWCRDAMAMVD